MSYKVSRRTTATLIVPLSKSEVKRIVESDSNATLIYQIGKKHFEKANFGTLGNTRMVYAVYYPYDEEIRVKVDGWFHVYIETEYSNEAEKIASEKWDNADFGELRDVDYNKTIVRCIL